MLWWKEKAVRVEERVSIKKKTEMEYLRQQVRSVEERIEVCIGFVYTCVHTVRTCIHTYIHPSMIKQGQYALILCHVMTCDFVPEQPPTASVQFRLPNLS